MRREKLGVQTTHDEDAHRETVIDLLTPALGMLVARYLLQRMPAATVAAVVLAATRTAPRSPIRSRLRVAASDLLRRVRGEPKLAWTVEEHGMSVRLELDGIRHVAGYGDTHLAALQDLFRQIELRHHTLELAMCTLDVSMDSTTTTMT